jgi:DUF971 family protein
MSYLNPTRVEPHSPTHMMIAWNDGKQFIVPYFEIRFHCPCAGCVDEHTGQRTLDRASVSASTRAVGVELVGRYALQIRWSDGHDTGMFHFERLRQLCETFGQPQPS